MDKFIENSRKWLENYITSNRLQSIVCGVSGGIDSTVSLAIAYPVCKMLEVEVIGRSLPTHTNSMLENSTAELVGEAFCTDFKTVSIDNMCNNIINDLESHEGKITNLQKGNVKARLRMIYLRNLASIHNGVVLDNDNFSEWNLGFYTIGGDSPMDINLGLHYLWKTDIYKLTKCLLDNTNDKCSKKALSNALNMVPTDGNGVSGSDCEQFGLDNYSQVDNVLKTIYYNTSNIDKDYIDLYDKQGVNKVMSLHRNTEFKRKSLPIMPTKKELGL